MGHASRPDAILIAGPTASGKSALALALAARVDGVIINADSMQVYRDLHVLTARPSANDESRAPHALYGTVDGAVAYSVTRWLTDAVSAMDHAVRAGKLPIFVGGTGLYFKALTQGLSEIPSVPPDVRNHWRSWAEGRPAAELHQELRRRDPAAAARLLPSDPQRVLRALEVQAATGESLATFQGKRVPGPLVRKVVAAHVLAVDRAELRARTDRRVTAMVENGALREVHTLRERGLDPKLPVMRALGVPQFLRYLCGETDLDSAVAATRLSTRAYLKRQSTFFRHQLPEFEPIAADRLEALYQFA